MVVLLTTAAGAQVVGAILTGTVTDPTGAAALNATVTRSSSNPLLSSR